VIWRWLSRAALIGAIAAHPRLRQTVLLAGGVVAFGLAYWFLSSFFATLDQIANPWLQLAFTIATALLVALASVAALVILGAWSRVKVHPAARSPSRERLDELFAKHGIEAPSITVMPAGRAADGPAVAVIGSPGVGRTTLIRALSEELASRERGANPRFVELPPLEADPIRQGDAVVMSADFDQVVLIVADDLKAHEMAALETIAKAGKRAIVVLAKADALRPGERAELVAALSERVAALPGPPVVVAASADPAPVVAELVTAEGTVKTTERRPPRSMAPLADAIEAALTRRGQARLP